MEKKSYEVVTDNWPRKKPVGAGTVLQLTDAEAKYSLLSGDLKLRTGDGAKEQQRGKPKTVNPTDAAKGEEA